MTTNRENIRKAYVLAHRASEADNHQLVSRQVFRAIAHQLWLACGKTAEYEMGTRPDELQCTCGEGSDPELAHCDGCPLKEKK